MSCWLQVPFCLAIVADAVMRRVASDIPSQARRCAPLHAAAVPSLTARSLASQVSVHLNDFTLGSADLSKQAATVPCMTPELNIARTRVLEYFNAQSISGKQSIFTWENGPVLNAATWLWLERSCTPRALPKDHSSKRSYLVSDTELLIKNFPEFECYRDVAFYCKFFLNKDIKAFPSGKEHTQKDARLQFQSLQASSGMINAFLVRGFGSILHCKALLRPASGSEQKLPPTARFGCSSAPSLYAFPHLLETEDDVLHTVDLPSFASTEAGQSGHALGQHDAELLLSFLTVPYLRGKHLPTANHHLPATPLPHSHRLPSPWQCRSWLVSLQATTASTRSRRPSCSRCVHARSAELLPPTHLPRLTLQHCATLSVRSSSTRHSSSRASTSTPTSPTRCPPWCLRWSLRS